MYNFPTNNLTRDYTEIRHHVTEIYREQQYAFRINLAFRMNLHNPETDEYKYYIPYYNSQILQYPFTISNRNGIRFLMHKLAGRDIIQQARAIRPSSSWTLDSSLMYSIMYLLQTSRLVKQKSFQIIF